MSLKFLLIGDSGIGKTNIILRYAKNEFSEDTMTTIGVSMMTKNVQVDGKSVKIQLQDTAGQERYRAVVKSFYNGVSFCLVVFDLTQPDTLKSVDYWMKEFTEANPNSKVAIVGNKCDSKIVCDGSETATKYKCDYYKVSALNGENIQQMFEKCIRQCEIKNERKMQQLPTMEEKKCC